MTTIKDHSNYKAVWEKCLQICYEYIQKGIEKQNEIEGILSSLEGGKKEFAIGSRYMHRGFYCPSPSMEYTITNMRRGRIAKRIDKRSRPTNSYLFDAEGTLRAVETFYINGSIQTEYLFYEEAFVFGVSYDDEGHISEISIEQYEESQIKEYLWACCYYNYSENTHLISHMVYETYHYDNKGYLDVEFYDMLGFRHDLYQYNRYRFHLDENGKVCNNKE